MIKLPKGDEVFRKKKNVLEWGADEFSIMTPRLKNYRTCLDIGAHCGITTLRFAQHFKSVHSFEPIHYDILVENTKHLPNVFAHNCAVSDKDGTVEIYPNIKNSGAGIIPDEHNSRFIKTRYTNNNARYKDIEKITVECSTIDPFNFDDVDLIKIDVEGHVLQVVNGMKNTLLVNSPVIQLEMFFGVDDFKTVNVQIHKILTDMGYVHFNTYNHDRFYWKP